MRKAVFILFTALCLQLMQTDAICAQIYNSEIEAEIVMEPNTEFISITAFAFNKTMLNHSLRYILSVISNEIESNNHSKSDQTGRFVLKPGEKRELASTVLNVSEEKRIIILLLVYDLEDKLLGKDRIVLNDSDENKEGAISQEEIEEIKGIYLENDGVILRGIVLEDTKTKPGRDFYQYYYTSYLANNINGPKIVTVKEVLTIGNNTAIELIVDDDTVMAFLVQPSNDYLKAMSYEAIRRTMGYFERLKKEEDMIKHF
ncbi:hypothetical protein J1N09_05430 [Aureitalea sp. L0-47]|uniref:curli production assembly/transport protein CsgE n=1 Tax=Aureitalea sp. L0-47 TaxID=2816962 RepID=UPI0022378E9F|nr:curli production assembly/transport protein CsgE [Aureitalea sp. L0-47]MCW5519270.1 hypothetical protein [Aureitalea sp. L0-47]